MTYNPLRAIKAYDQMKMVIRTIAPTEKMATDLIDLVNTEMKVNKREIDWAISMLARYMQDGLIFGRWAR